MLSTILNLNDDKVHRQILDGLKSHQIGEKTWPKVKNFGLSESGIQADVSGLTPLEGLAFYSWILGFAKGYIGHTASLLLAPFPEGNGWDNIDTSTPLENE